MTVHDLYQEFVSQQTQLRPASQRIYAYVLSRLPAPHDLTASLFRKRSENVSPSTIHQELAITRKFVKWWCDNAKSDGEKQRAQAVLAELKSVKHRKIELTETALYSYAGHAVAARVRSWSKWGTWGD